MKRFVLRDSMIPVAAGIIGAVIVALTEAGTGMTYLIALGLLVVVLRINLGPDRVQLRREKH